MKYFCFIILFCVFNLISFAQASLNDIKQLEGIWIAEDYFNSFEKTKSATKSKKAFSPDYPVALRINSSEIRNGKLNIGYSVLHDHLLHSEVSEYSEKHNDSISEQGSFKINLRKKDSLGYYKTTGFYYFDFDWVSYLTWDKDYKKVELYRPYKNKDFGKEKIIYKKITNSFFPDYPHPNPLYFYTRLKNLKGSYILKDDKGNILSNHITINHKGLIDGYKSLDDLTVYYSTDIYCGRPPDFNIDIVILLKDVKNVDGDTYVYAFSKDKYGNLSFSKIERGDNGHESIGKTIYKFIRK